MRDADQALPPRAQLGVIAAILCTVILAGVDGSFVSVATPRLLAEFKGFDQISWILTPFLMANAITMPIVSRINDFISVRITITVGLLVFIGGALACSASWSVASFAVFRAIQGIGDAAILCSSMIIIARSLPADRQPRVQGLIGVTISASLLVGPFISGFFIDHFTWRALFWLSTIPGLAAMALLLASLPRIQGVRQSGFDWIGALLLSSFVLPMLAGLSALRSGGAPGGRVIATFVVSALALVGFGTIKRPRVRLILPMSLLRTRKVLFYLFAISLNGVTYDALYFYLPLYVQSVAAATATASAVYLMGTSVASGICSYLSGQTASRRKISIHWFIALGFLCCTIGYALLASSAGFTLRPRLWLAVCLIGVGLGIGTPMFMLAVQRSAPADQLGASTGGAQLFRQLGSGIGVTALATILRLSSHAQLDAAAEVHRAALDDPSLLSDAARLAQLKAQLGPAADAVIHGVRSALASGIAWLFITAAVASALGLVLVLAAGPPRAPEP